MEQAFLNLNIYYDILSACFFIYNLGAKIHAPWTDFFFTWQIIITQIKGAWSLFIQKQNQTNLDMSAYLTC